MQDVDEVFTHALESLLYKKVPNAFFWLTKK